MGSAGVGLAEYEEFTIGGSVGLGGDRIGRICGTFLVSEETMDITADYAYLLGNSFVSIGPKIGVGYVSREERSYSYYNQWDPYYYNSSSGAFGIKAGILINVDIGKRGIICGGYDQFIGLSDDDAGHGSLIGSLGVKF